MEKKSEPILPTFDTQGIDLIDDAYVILAKPWRVDMFPKNMIVMSYHMIADISVSTFRPSEEYVEFTEVGDYMDFAQMQNHSRFEYFLIRYTIGRFGQSRSDEQVICSTWDEVYDNLLIEKLTNNRDFISIEASLTPIIS